MVHVLDTETAASPTATRASAVASRPAIRRTPSCRPVFVALPILAGLDEFFHLLVNWLFTLAEAPYFRETKKNRASSFTDTRPNVGSTKDDNPTIPHLQRGPQ
jgi:hypothetical protein